MDSNLQNLREIYISVVSKQLSLEHPVRAAQADRRCKGWRKGKGMKWVEAAAAETMLEGAIDRI